MGVSQGMANWRRERGHDVVHLRDEGRQRLPNGEIFAKAGAEQRIILTFDRDFGETVAFSDGQVVSVVAFRLNNTRTQFVVARLATVRSEVETAVQEGAIVVVEDGRHRVRRLPLGT